MLYVVVSIVRSAMLIKEIYNDLTMNNKKHLLLQVPFTLIRAGWVEQAFKALNLKIGP